MQPNTYKDTRVKEPESYLQATCQPFVEMSLMKFERGKNNPGMLFFGVVGRGGQVGRDRFGQTQVWITTPCT